MLVFIQKWRWGLLSLVFLILVFLEYSESHFSHYLAWLDLLAYFSLCALIGIMGNILVKALQKQTRANQLLESKYKLNLTLTTITTWEDLAAEVARFPSDIAPVDQACLIMNNPISQQLEAIAAWRSSQEIAPDNHVETISLPSAETQSTGLSSLWQFTAPEVYHPNTLRHYFCLPICHRHTVLAYLQCRLISGNTLGEQEQELLRNISTDLGLTLAAGKDHLHLSEMRIAEQAERELQNLAKAHQIQLRQSIAQLHSKMNQIIDNANLPLAALRAELVQLQEISNAIYEVVHPKAKSTHTDTPHLNGLLHEQARKVAQRAGIILTFKSEGRQLPIEAETQKAIAAVFQETLTNIEKHARATKVSVFIGWAFDILTVSVTDNGVGFSPNGMGRGNHFGLERMNERIAALGGQIDLRSSAGEGATVTFIIPNLSEHLHVPVA